MDELSALKDFRAEREAEPAEAREAIWRALEARIEAATEESRAFGEGIARTAPRPGTVRRRRGLRTVRARRVAIFAAAALLAAVVTGALVLRDGPTAQPASAAEILHEAASAAAATEGAPTTLVPGPGQFLYRDEQRLGIEGWVFPVPRPDEPIATLSLGAPVSGPHGYNAVVSTRNQNWLGDEGEGRNREVLTGLDFWSKGEEDRWRKAGSPLPPPFSAEYRQVYKSGYEGAAANDHVVDQTHEGYGGTFHFPDTSMLPTEAPELRQQAEANELDYTGFNHVGGPTPKALDPEETKEELLNVLQEGFPAPPLQAAIFNALAELPGIEVTRDVTDGTGRQGAAIDAGVEDGIRRQSIFDPETGELLGSRGILVDPKARGLEGIPAGTVVDERDFLAVGLVDSTAETPGGGEAPETGEAPAR